LQQETVSLFNLFSSKVPNLGYKKEAKQTGASTFPEKKRESPPIYVLPYVRLWSCDSKRKKQYVQKPLLMAYSLEMAPNPVS
jgi:hypothetical protein